MNAKQYKQASGYKKFRRRPNKNTISSSSNSSDEVDDEEMESDHNNNENNNIEPFEFNPIEDNVPVDEINIENEENSSSSDDSSEPGNETMTDLDETLNADHLWSTDTDVCSVGTTAFCIMLLSVARLHNLTDAAVAALLRLFRTVLPENNNVPAKPGALRNKAFWKSAKRTLPGGQKIERRCSDCENTIACNNNESTWICANRNCEIFGIKQSVSEYISCSIRPQIEIILTLFGGKILKHLIKTNQYRTNTGNISDITNGSKYLRPNPNGNNLTINLILWSDGARPVNGRRGNIWLCSATVAELPPRLRFTAWNIISLSFYYGRGKPNWFHLINCNLDELNELSTRPFEVTINGDKYNVYVRLYASLLDLVARCSIWDVKQFNGEYGCMECQHPGVQEGRGSRLWPYREDVEPKDNAFYETVYAALEDERRRGEKKKSLFGIFKKSELATVLKAATDSPIDFMHNVYEGFACRILYALFVKQLPGKRLLFFNTNKIKMLDVFVKKILWPSDFKRKVPSFALVKQFKATEIKNCLCIMIPLLYEDYYLRRCGPSQDETHLFMHFLAMYIEITRILVSDSISEEQLNIVDKLAVAVIRLIPDALHKDEQTFNSHCTLHLADYARLYGPLHGISAFAFESLNHVYCRLASGSKGTLDQIQKRGSEQKMIHYWIDKHIDSQTDFSDALRYVIRNVKKVTSWDATVVQKDDASKVTAHEAALIPFTDFQTAVSVEYKHVLYESDLKQLKSRCNYVAAIQHAEFKFVKIHRFFISQEGSFVFTGFPLKIVSRIIDNIEKPENIILNDVDVNLYGNFHFVVEQLNDLKCFAITVLKSLCIYMKFDETMYVTPLAHAYEHD